MLRSIKKAYEIIKAQDNETSITIHTIRVWCKEGEITSFKHGNRWVLNYDEVIEALREYVKTYSGHPIAKQNKRKLMREIAIGR